MPRRCVFGCVYRPDVTFHQFPHPEKNHKSFMDWVNIVGGKLDTEADTELYRKKVICDIHFEDRFKNRNKRLNALAVPTLCLYGLGGGGLDRITTVFPAAPELQASELNVQNNQSMSRLTLIESSDKIFTPFSAASEMPAPKCRLWDKPSTSRMTVNAGTPAARITAVEHNYCKASGRPQRNVKNNKKPKQLGVNSSILNELKATRNQLNQLGIEIKKLLKKNESYKARLISANKISKHDCFKKLAKNMTVAARILTKMQIRQTKKKSGGRRFTLEEKVLSLSMYKRSPKHYTLLYKLFTLPSTKSLKRLLAAVEIKSGLNKSVFIKMKETVRDLSPEDRLCSLIFDEMSISPQIHYDSSKDKLKGFAWRNKKIADHVIVFMVKGVKKNFKQPVAYYFTNCLNKINLIELIKNVITYVQRTGLVILCTICDQSTINVSAINDLIQETKQRFLKDGQEWRQSIVEVGKSKIIPLFDVPHLLKGVRNNILTKDLKYFDFEEMQEKTIKWEYYQQIYEADKSYGELKMLQKLTDEHIYREKIKKMKVKAAAQIFSHSVAVAAEHLTARGNLPIECRQVIKFTKMMDNLFDSLNASNFTLINGKIFKSAVRRNSPHHALWENALKVLKTVKFVVKKKEKNNDKVRLVESSAIPTIKNFIRTIEGIQYLWKILSQRYSFDSMLTRNFNQDPLENFFGNIRSYGVRNTAPNTLAFEGAYKSLLLNNYNSPHSLQANCEYDNNDCLQTLDFFLNHNRPSNVPTNEASQFQHEESDDIVVPYINLNPETIDAGQGNYVCGWVLAKCLQKISKSCQHCKNEIQGDHQSTSNEYIQAKEYKKGVKSLVYPSECAAQCFIQIQNITIEILKKDVPKTHLKEKIKYFVDIFVDYPFTCDSHKNKLKISFTDITINVLIYSWCRSINRILSGKLQYHGEDDEIKFAAQMYYNKNKHKK